MNYKGCNKKEAVICIDCSNEIGKGEAIALRLKNGRLFCFCRVCDSEWSADVNYASMGKVRKLMRDPSFSLANGMAIISWRKEVKLLECPNGCNEDLI